MRFIIFISSSIILISGGILLIVYTRGWYFFGGWYGGLMLIFLGISALVSPRLSVIWDEAPEVVFGSFVLLINCPIIMIAGGIHGLLHGEDPHEETTFIFLGVLIWGLFIPVIFRRGKNKRKDGTSGRNDWELSEKNDRNQ
ncbi:hypothetical protein QUF80_11645 [Desulfococcaceae bacterium HSG8]|nr:hypothetical protein [Desulfococcaceae bacterium HSG8]